MNAPPRIERRILELALPQRVRAGVLGDLDEEYRERMLPERGERAARCWYRRQVLQSLPHALRFARSTGNTLWSQGDGFMVTFLKDLKYAGRMMVRNRTFSLIAVLTLACGIGANTAVFSVVQAVLFRPLPYEEPDRPAHFFRHRGRVPGRRSGGLLRAGLPGNKGRPHPVSPVRIACGQITRRGMATDYTERRDRDSCSEAFPKRPLSNPLNPWPFPSV